MKIAAFFLLSTSLLCSTAYAGAQTKFNVSQEGETTTIQVNQEDKKTALAALVGGIGGYFVGAALNTSLSHPTAGNFISAAALAAIINIFGHNAITNSIGAQNLSTALGAEVAVAGTTVVLGALK